ncbi:MAG: PhoU domain-containing protein [Bacteroidales bacterium]
MRIIDIKYNEIRTQFIEMLNLTHTQLEESFKIITEPDIELSRKIIKQEFLVDKLEYKLNKNCEKFLLTCNPVADDLRNIMIINNMIPNIERISDITVKIARFVKKYNTKLPADFLNEIKLHDLLFHIKFMFETVIESYTEYSTIKLQDVFNRDTEVNKITKHSKKTIISTIDNSDVDTKKMIDFLLIITQLERLGDYLKATSEEIYFGVEGIFIKHSY